MSPQRSPAHDQTEARLITTLLISRLPEHEQGHLLARPGGEPGGDPRLEDPGLRLRAGEELAQWRAEGIGVVARGSTGYPAELSHIHAPPPLLFYRGTPLAEYGERPAVSIVGSRRGDSEACAFARELAAGIARRGGIVVSGLALGIDAAAHRGALEPTSLRQTTIAVLGNGLRRVYPSLHERLAEEILARGGTVVSQFEPDERPWPVNFLNRNRVIAGLSRGIIVVQAAARSGSLATARHALEEGREVMSVPWGVREPRAAGSNRLLQQGAHLIMGLEDVARIVPGLTGPPAPASTPPSAVKPDHVTVITAFGDDRSLSFDELRRRCAGLPGLSTTVLELELARLVERLPGNQIARRS